ncbi:MAG: SRPBCC family protein [Gloeobacterales cyanobacterium]
MAKFEVSTTVNLPLEEVWKAHEDVTLLERIAPPYPKIRLLEPKVVCALGTRFTVRVELLGPAALDWQVQIIRWEPPSCFVDQQVSGPFSFWEHTHQFIPISADKTRLVDAVNFELNPFLDDNVIRFGLETMFQWRMENLKQALSQP